MDYVNLFLINIKTNKKYEIQENQLELGNDCILECKDKRISKQHGKLKIISAGKIAIIAIDNNSIFYKKRNSDDDVVIPYVQNNAEIILENGDSFGFLPSEFWFQVNMKESLENATSAADTTTSMASTCNDKYNQSSSIQRKRQLPNWLLNNKSPISLTQSKIRKLNTATTNISPKKVDAVASHSINSYDINVNKIDNNSTNSIEFTNTSNDTITATTDPTISINNTSDAIPSLVSVNDPISFTVKPTNLTPSACTSSVSQMGQIRVKKDIFNSNSSGGNVYNIVSNVKNENKIHIQYDMDVPTRVQSVEERIKLEIKSLIDELPEDIAEQPLENECEQEQPQNGVQVKKEQEDEPNSTDDQPLNTATTSTNTNIQFPVRQSCQYGIRCYRLNPTHRIQASHPGDSDYKRPYHPPAPTTAPPCPFGHRCYRRNPVHFQQFSHPPATDLKRNRELHKLSKTGKNNNADLVVGGKRKRNNITKVDYGLSDADVDEDDYDLNDPFINDDSSDDYKPTDENDSESDDSDSQDIVQTQDLDLVD